MTGVIGYWVFEKLYKEDMYNTTNILDIDV